MIPEVFELRVGEQRAVAALTSKAGTMFVWIRENDQLFGMGDGEGAQQNRVQDTEDRGIGSNSQSNRQDRNQGEAGVFRQYAQRESQVLPEICHSFLLCALIRWKLRTSASEQAGQYCLTAKHLPVFAHLSCRQLRSLLGRACV